MLQHLYIKDLAIVSEVDIAFYSGMTVITGETGAGKSILLDALGLALGERSESQLVRPGAEKAEIAATFEISGLPGAVLWLAELDLATSDPDLCIIRRILYANGRSRAFINGHVATTQQLRLLGEHLVQIHGQHQHQQLLKSTEQLRVLDAFGQHDALVSQVKTAYKDWEKLSSQQQAIQKSAVDEARKDLLQYQLSEIEALQLGERELSLLYQEHDKLAHAQSSLQACEDSLNRLAQQPENNVVDLINEVQFILRPLMEKGSLQNIKDCLENTSILIQEAVRELKLYIHQIEMDPVKLNEIEYRLERIHDMARKHKIEPLQLPHHYQLLQNTLAQYQNNETRLQKLEEDLRLAKLQFTQYASTLTVARQQSASRLAEEVTRQIRRLGMPNAVFTIELITFDDDIIHVCGHETAQFGVSANPGHAAQPLHKVASGGELSRISLALELITAKFLATPCLIFDEVDVGISGKTGSIVGKALYELSQQAQTLCITHLPQVAAYGDHHIQVNKCYQENSTTSDVQVLTEDKRIDEIARMLGGIDATSQAHAKTLLLSEKLILDSSSTSHKDTSNAL